MPVNVFFASDVENSTVAALSLAFQANDGRDEAFLRGVLAMAHHTVVVVGGDWRRVLTMAQRQLGRNDLAALLESGRYPVNI